MNFDQWLRHWEFDPAKLTERQKELLLKTYEAEQKPAVPKAQSAWSQLGKSRAVFRS